MSGEIENTAELFSLLMESQDACDYSEDNAATTLDMCEAPLESAEATNLESHGKEVAERLEYASNLKWLRGQIQKLVEEDENLLQAKKYKGNAFDGSKYA